MFCQMLTEDGVTALVEAIPDFYVKDEDYMELIHNKDLRVALYRGLRSEGFKEAKIFIGNLGKEVNGVFKYSSDFDVSLPITTLRGLGYYEKL